MAKVTKAEKSVTGNGSVNRITEALGNGAAVAAKAPDIKKASGPKVGRVEITPLNLIEASFKVRGIVPLVLNRFSAKAQAMIKATQEAGSTAKKGKQREAKDFDAAYAGARYIAEDGWDGFPASAVRCAMISACRTVGFAMTLAKLSVFCVQDGFDATDHTPLVRITKGKPDCHIGPARNANGSIDLRARPMFKEGWEANITIRFDGNSFTLSDIANLMARVGLQVGLGEGRPDSRDSAGCGWGQFELVNK